MKTRKSNKLIDKLREAYSKAEGEVQKTEIRILGEELTAVHTKVIAFLNRNKQVNTPSVPF